MIPASSYTGLINRYRAPLMALAILVIVFAHAPYPLAGWPGVFKNLSYCGVDLFLFLSGMGVYHSLDRDPSVPRFYRRRMVRILPAYLIYLLIWALPFFAAVSTPLDLVLLVRDLLANVFPVGWLLGLPHQTNWYVQAQLILYLAAPPLVALVKDINGSRKGLLCLALCTAGLNVCFLFHGSLMFISRIPVFLVGVLLSDARRREARVPLHLLLSAAAAGAGLMLYCYFYAGANLAYYGLSWYPFLLIVPGGAWLAAKELELLERVKAVGPFLVKVLTVIGQSSFEICLIHVGVYERVPAYLDISRLRYLLPVTAASILAGILFHFLLARAAEALRRRREPAK